MNPCTLPDGNVQIAFSGGRTSAYMLHQIMEANGGLGDAVVTFQNTGREMPQTLDFVAEVGARWGVPIVWLEYVGGPSVSFAIVNHNSASRNGEPFEALLRRRQMLPNLKARFCTEELKIRTAKRYLMALGWKGWTAARGIRRDELARHKPPVPKERATPWHPLFDAGVSKHDVAIFWRRQPFRLRLQVVKGKTLMGNCDGCFLKSEQNVALLARDYPERAAWWERMEAEHAHTARTHNGGMFSKRYSRRELREHIQRMGPGMFSTEGALCQADDGECF
jgi:3'-phosphoadenosine 5'-phosphosulfate sulfotransferase (PAPS reductase)/FAD synthetase